MTTTPASKNYRWVPVISSITIQMCLGTAYIWSVFQSYLIISASTPTHCSTACHTWNPAYALLLGVLTFGSTVGGRIQDRLKNPKPVIIAAGIILGIAFSLRNIQRSDTMGAVVDIWHFRRLWHGDGLYNYYRHLPKMVS